jgi:small-conductance mechanosensitive channel
MKGVKTLTQRAGLKSDIEVEKEMTKVVANPKPVSKKIKSEAVAPVAPAKEEIQKVKRVKKVLMDEDGNILKMERKKRELSEEQKVVLRERLAKAREVRAIKRTGISADGM